MSVEAEAVRLYLLRKGFREPQDVPIPVTEGFQCCKEEKPYPLQNSIAPETQHI